VKAVLSRVAGGTESLTLEEIPAPTPGNGQVRIAVRACAVNYPDVLIIQDLYQFKPARPFAPGAEVSGVVESIGPGVERVSVGDRVLAMVGWGGMVEQVVVDERKCCPIPDSMPFDEAAAFLLTYGTSYLALKNRAALKSGETLLVLGAAGGVGLAAVEIGKAMGARVIAAASSEAKTALAIEHGAAASLVYPRGPFDKSAAKELTEQFKSICGSTGAHVIFDAIGGDYAEPALRAIAWEGRYLVIGFPAGIPKIPLNLPLLKSSQIVGVFWGAWIERDPEGHAENVRELLNWYKRGAIKPLVTERYPMSRAGEAIARLASREATGKIVVTMD
jgi:NADPH2:quinone reductase